MASCRRVRHKLALLVGGELEPMEVAAVRSHLQGCPACARELEGLRRAREQLASLATWDWDQLGPGVLDDVLRRIREEARPAAEKRPLLRRLLWVLSAAAVAAACLAVVVSTGGLRPDAGTPSHRPQPAPGSVGTERPLTKQAQWQSDHRVRYRLQWASQAGTPGLEPMDRTGDCTYRLDLADAVSVAPVSALEF